MVPLILGNSQVLCRLRVSCRLGRVVVCSHLAGEASLSSFVQMGEAKGLYDGNGYIRQGLYRNDMNYSVNS